MIFGLSTQELEQRKAIFTAEEIFQQPATWAKTLAQIAAMRPQLREFIEGITSQDDFEVILTGAGTSEYVGNALKPALLQTLNGRVQSYGTTDIVASPYTYLNPDKPTLLVSFARSGNSPESVGAVEAADAVCSNLRHLFITCNSKGKLAQAAQARDNCLSVVLTPETNDRSFAMTSSFSNMYLAALLTFLPEAADETDAICKAAAAFLSDKWQVTAALLSEKKFNRIVYLGTDVLRGIAQESALKVLELTAGKIVALHDSPMGFRHGPKSVVDENTLTVVYLSDDPIARRYETDLLHELYRDRKGSTLLAVVNSASKEITDCCDVCLSMDFGRQMGNASAALAYVTVAQVLALQCSLSLGLTPDNPCPTGEVNRVVKGVTIYPLQGREL